MVCCGLLELPVSLLFDGAGSVLICGLVRVVWF